MEGAFGVFAGDELSPPDDEDDEDDESPADDEDDDEDESPEPLLDEDSLLLSCPAPFGPRFFEP